MIYFLPLEVLLYCFFDVRGKDERVYFLNTLDQFQRPLDVPRVYGTSALAQPSNQILCLQGIKAFVPFLRVHRILCNVLHLWALSCSYSQVSFLVVFQLVLFLLEVKVQVYCSLLLV